MGLIWAVVGALCAIAFLYVIVLMDRNTFAANALDALLAVIEVGLVVQLVVGLAKLSDAPADLSKATWIGYLIGSLLILPVAWVWSQAERKKADSMAGAPCLADMGTQTSWSRSPSREARISAGIFTQSMWFCSANRTV